MLVVIAAGGVLRDLAFAILVLMWWAGMVRFWLELQPLPGAAWRNYFWAVGMISGFSLLGIRYGPLWFQLLLFAVGLRGSLGTRGN